MFFVITHTGRIGSSSVILTKADPVLSHVYGICGNSVWFPYCNYSVCESWCRSEEPWQLSSIGSCSGNREAVGFMAVGWIQCVWINVQCFSKEKQKTDLQSWLLQKRPAQFKKYFQHIQYFLHQQMELTFPVEHLKVNITNNRNEKEIWLFSLFDRLVSFLP